jgi:hypothetical protein
MSCRIGARLAVATLICGIAHLAIAAPLTGRNAPPGNVARNAAPADLGVERDERDIVSRPMHRERGGRISLMIVGRKTVAPRSSDTLANVRKYRQWSVAAAVALRGAEDFHFTAKANSLAQRLGEINGFASSPQVAPVATGAEFLAALVEASRQGPIVNVAVYGHAAQDALYMMEDRGFYTAVSNVARATQLAVGGNAEKEESLRGLGARDLSDLEALVNSGAIRFAKNAVIVFTGCAVAGKQNIDFTGIAARVAEITGVIAIASIDVTDQSMLFGRNVLDVFYSRGTWVRFVGRAKPEQLNTKRIEVLKFMNLEDSEIATKLGLPIEDIPPTHEKLNCAMRTAPASGNRDLGICGERASNGDALADLGKREMPASPM